MIYIYTDASFSSVHELAIVGFALFRSTHEHETLSVSEFNLNLRQITERNNIRSELRAAIEALKSCPKNERILLFSDCRALCDLPKRREKLVASQFMSRGKGRLLANADLYQEFYSLYDSTRPELRWIKGHSPSDSLSKIQKNFYYLDKAVRKKLRAAISVIL